MRYFAILTTTLAFAGCGGTPSSAPSADVRVTPPTTVTLGAREMTVVKGVELTFGGVSEDDRCPIDVLCVRAGNARVELGVGPLVGTRGPTYLVAVNTTEGSRYGEAWGLRVTLVAPRRERRSGAEIPPEEYVVELRVEGVAALTP